MDRNQHEELDQRLAQARRLALEPHDPLTRDAGDGFENCRRSLGGDNAVRPASRNLSVSSLN